MSAAGGAFDRAQLGVLVVDHLRPLAATEVETWQRLQPLCAHCGHRRAIVACPRADIQQVAPFWVDRTKAEAPPLRQVHGGT
jgi:hypothetical protein